MHLKVKFKGEMGDLTIKVSLGKGTITISDRGIGLTAEEIDKYINQIAFSGANDSLKNIKMMPMPSSDTLVWDSILPSW